MSYVPPRRVIAPHPRSLDEVVGRNLPQRLVDFLLIDLERDLCAGIYLTLGLARVHESRHVRAMYTTVAAFFSRVDQLIVSAKKGDRIALQRVRAMLEFPEPWELRLGYAGTGSYGSGVGVGDLRDYLLDVLWQNPELRRTLTVHPDALTFIPEIAMDRTSDIIATIGKRHLVAFTREMAAFYQFSRSCLDYRPVNNCWNPSAGRLDSMMAVVPTDDLRRTFLLVPKTICRSGPPMNAGQYFSDLDPKGGGAADGLTWKAAMLEDAAANPGRLMGFADERMKDPTRYQPRRDLRPPKAKR